MFLSTLVLSALVASATAQNSYTFPAGFNLGLTSSDDRNAWCQGERNTCPQICGGSANSNTCDPDTLSFSCVCSNGTAANVALYQNTIPFFVCQANFGQCIQAHVSDAAGQEECKKERKANCGTLNATALEEASSSAAASTSAPATSSLPASTAAAATTQKGSPTAASSGSAAATTTNAAVTMVQNYSTGLLATVLFVFLRLAL